MGNSDSSGGGGSYRSDYSSSSGSSGGNWSTATQSASTGSASNYSGSTSAGDSTKNGSVYNGATANSAFEACSKGFHQGVQLYNDANMGSSHPNPVHDKDHVGMEASGKVGAGVGGCVAGVIQYTTK